MAHGVRRLRTTREEIPISRQNTVVTTEASMHCHNGGWCGIEAMAAKAKIWNNEPAGRCRHQAITSEHAPATTVVAAVVPLVGRTTRHRVARGIQRIIGTVLGLILLAGVLLLNPAPWQTVLVIAVCQFGAEMFIARQYVLAQVFVTPLALSSTLLAAPAVPEVLLRDRIVETVIGAAVGIAVVVTPVVWRRLRAGSRAQRVAA